MLFSELLIRLLEITPICNSRSSDYIKDHFLTVIIFRGIWGEYFLSTFDQQITLGVKLIVGLCTNKLLNARNTSVAANFV